MVIELHSKASIPMQSQYPRIHSEYPLTKTLPYPIKRIQESA